MAGLFLGVLAGTLVLGLWHRATSAVLAAMVGHVSNALLDARNRVGESREGLRTQLVQQRDAHDPRVVADRRPLLPGAVLASAFFTLFVAAESVTLSETLRTMSPSFANLPDLGSWLSATMLLSIISTFVFAEWLKVELQEPRLLHTSGWSNERKGRARRQAITIMGLAVVTTLLMGAFRTDRMLSMPTEAGSDSTMVDPMVSGDPSTLGAAGVLAVVPTAAAPVTTQPHRLLEIAANASLQMGMAVALFLAAGLAAFAGPLSLLEMLRPLMIPFVMLGIAAFVLAIVQVGWNMLAGILLSVVALFQRIGIWLVRPAVTYAREMHAHHASIRSSDERRYSRAIYALTLPALDVELPEDAIGARPTIDTPEQPAVAEVNPDQVRRQDDDGAGVNETEAIEPESHLPEQEHVWGPFAGPATPSN